MIAQCLKKNKGHRKREEGREEEQNKSDGARDQDLSLLVS